MKACHRYLDDGHKFPVPADIRERIVGVAPEFESKDKFILSPGQVCSQCGRIRFCIKDDQSGCEWECRECYTGLTAEEHRAKMAELTKEGEP